MDMHILLSSCNFHEFKCISFNYTKIEEHSLFSDVKDSMRETGVEMTRAIMWRLFIDSASIYGNSAFMIHKLLEEISL